jgi:hypothetical protein
MPPSTTEPERRSQRCAREGCERRASHGYETCSLSCRTVWDKMTQAEAMCRAMDDPEAIGRLWSATTDLNDALTAHAGVLTDLYRSGALARGQRWSGASPTAPAPLSRCGRVEQRTR